MLHPNVEYNLVSYAFLSEKKGPPFKAPKQVAFVPSFMTFARRLPRLK
jgi:hypothetical protein